MRVLVLFLMLFLVSATAWAEGFSCKIGHTLPNEMQVNTFDDAGIGQPWRLDLNWDKWEFDCNHGPCDCGSDDNMDSVTGIGIKIRWNWTNGEWPAESGKKDYEQTFLFYPETTQSHVFVCGSGAQNPRVALALQNTSYGVVLVNASEAEVGRPCKYVYHRGSGEIYEMNFNDAHASMDWDDESDLEMWINSYTDSWRAKQNPVHTTHSGLTRPQLINPHQYPAVFTQAEADAIDDYWDDPGS